MKKLKFKDLGRILKTIPYTSVVLCVVLLVIYLMMGSEANEYESIPIKYMVLWGSNFSGLTLGGESWRLFTSTFLHFNIMHLLVNTYSLYVIGNLLEKKIGFIWFILYFILFGVSGGLASLIWNVYTVSAGASGALFGLIGFYFVFSLNPSQERNTRHSASILVIIILNLLFGFFNNSIDNAAHIGGLILGAIVGSIFLIPFKRSWFNPSFKKLSGLVLSALLLFSTYQSIPTDRVEYYEFFLYMLEKEEKALSIQDQEGSMTNPNYYSDLTIANNHWQDIQDSIKLLHHIGYDGIKKDTANFRMYIDYQQKIVRYLQKISEQESFIFLDSVDRTYQLINNMPPLHYPLNLFPRERTKDTLTKKKTWYDQDWVETKDSLNAAYYRISKVDSLGRCHSFATDYYADGSVQMKGNYSYNLMNGIFYFFYRERSYDAIGMMSDDRKIGKWQYFYRDGQLKSEVMFHRNKRSEVLHFWNKNGVQTVKDGNGFCNNFNEKDSIYETGQYLNHYKHGTWNGYYADSSPYYVETYEDGELMEGKSVSKSGKHFFYSRIYEEPLPRIGWENYYRYIDSSMSKNLINLPNTIYGNSSLRLFIDTSGTIKEIVPVRIIGYGIEHQIMELVNENPNFTAGKFRGQKQGMETYIYVPIN